MRKAAAIVVMLVLSLTTSPATAHPNGWDTWKEYRKANSTCSAVVLKELSGEALLNEATCRSELRRDWKRFDSRYWHSLESDPVVSSPVSGSSGESVSHSGPHNWIAVAGCESSGNWASGDGIGPDVTGGLQIATGTWLAFGGGEFASKAMYATPSEQITVAERIAFTGYGSQPPQGIGAWPHCGYLVFT